MREIRLSHKEQNQVSILESIQRGEITQKEGAAILAMSVRQVIRRLQRYVKEGLAGLAHKSRGRPSNRAIPPEIRQQVAKLLSTKYKDFGPTFAAEKLAENEGIVLNHETVRRIMIAEGLLEKRSRKLNKHVWREPKHHFGELVQIDGSPHRWFGEDQEKSTLMAMVDDASNRSYLMFAQEETTQASAEITELYIKKYGRPRKLYSDKGKTFKVNNGSDLKKRKTQYQRMLGELDIEIAHAHTPQAKGRIERSFKKHQDRLVKELALRGIKTIEKANKFLREVYIDAHNKKFEKQAKGKLDLHQSIEGYDLKSIFCLKKDCTLNSDNTVQYKGRWFLLSKKQPIPLYKKSVVTVCENFDKTIVLMHKGQRLEYREIEKRPAKEPAASTERKVSNVIRKPSKNHPWFNGIHAKKSDISKKLKT